MSGAEYDAMMKALDGEKVLVQPRVSRETIIDVLREHTEILRGLRREYDATKVIVNGLVDITERNKENIGILQHEIVESKADIASLKDTTCSIVEELKQIKDTLGEVANIKTEMKVYSLCNVCLSL